jgi:cyclomaltodextrinase / maltogenic alpha-amylase / neopullulanase
MSLSRLTAVTLLVGAFLLVMPRVLPVKTVAAQQKQDFSKLPARKSQEWVHNGVIYEIFPRVFSPEGNFNGVTARLDNLKSLGVTILWIMPIHPISKEKRKGTLGSPYAVADYYAVNPDYGTKEDFKRLVAEAHKRGFKVIIDIVANHTGWDSVMMANPDFYTRADGKIIPPIPEWTDVADLNYDNPKLRAYMIDMLKYWLREFDLDGFRCDVAGFVPTDFWEQARAELEKVKSDIFMLAEWSEPDLMVKAFDADYAWPLLHTLEDVFMKGAAATELKKTWLEERARFPQGVLHMRMSDNHDELRAVAKFGAEGARAASALMFTFDGVPLLYNGMEIGDTAESGAPALFEKSPVLWEFQERRPNVLPFYKELVALRRQHRALQSGATEWLSNSDEARIVSYVRRDAKEEFLVVVNCSNRPFIGAVEVAGGDAFRDVTPGAGATKRPVALPTVSLEGWGFRIFHREVKGA